LALDYQQLDAAGKVTADLGASAPSAAGNYRVTVSFAGSADYVPASASTLFTIARAAPVVKVTGGEAVYDGQPYDATGSVIGVNGAALGTPIFSYKDATGHAVTHPVNAGTYTVTASYAGSTNYTPASATATITIDRAPPAFTGLAAPAITYGAASATLSGKVCLGSLVPTGSVSITVAGLTTNSFQIPLGKDGSFSVTVPTGTLRPGSYAVSYRYGGDANFAPVAAAGTLRVSYGVRPLLPANLPVASGGVLPVAVQLTNAGGANVSSANVPVTAVSLVAADGSARPVRALGGLNPRLAFFFSPIGYFFFLDTSGLRAGTYTLYVSAGNDPVLHPLTFHVR
jgi:hypothetical protein